LKKPPETRHRREWFHRRRLFQVITESLCAGQAPAESRLQPGLAAPPRFAITSPDPPVRGMLQGVPSIPSTSIPPVSADCETTTQPAQPGVATPKPVPWKLFRSADGKTCADYGNKSVISDPGSNQAIVLDHVKKEASIFPMPPAPKPGQAPGGLPGQAPTGPSANVQDLGKKFIDGHEAVGKQYTLPPMKPPSPPGVAPPAAPSPQAPALAGKLPGMPKLPGLPTPPAPGAGAPAANPPAQPQMPRTVEVWTSTTQHVPVLTKVTGSFGQQINKCKCGSSSEPPASKFQIPSGYKVVQMPKPPKPPGLPTT
jgi:hypothetical protein